MADRAFDLLARTWWFVVPYPLVIALLAFAGFGWMLGHVVPWAIDLFFVISKLAALWLAFAILLLALAKRLPKLVDFLRICLAVAATVAGFALD